jgi:hypothetical protein
VATPLFRPRARADSSPAPPGSPGRRSRIADLAGDPDLADRLARLRRFSRTIRTSEYHVTNACNLRCRGCWFFAYDYDRATREVRPLEAWRAFARKEAARGVTSALLIGGEPTLHPERVAAFVEAMPYVTVSSNGLRELPRQGFERVQVALTLFGGGPLDDDLRGHHPSGRRIAGLFDQALLHYKDDPRVCFIYALVGEGLAQIEPTVRRIRDNGNRVTFNYYSRYGEGHPLRREEEGRLLEEALRVRELHPETVRSHPYYLKALLTGRTEWGEFGYATCPSISVDHPAHAERLKNGNPVLPGFNAWGADLETVQFCCTSGHCEGCRDSQAVYSWLLTNLKHFLGSPASLRTWVEVAESYWSQFVWSEYHPGGALCPR